MEQESNNSIADEKSSVPSSTPSGNENGTGERKATRELVSAVGNVGTTVASFFTGGAASVAKSAGTQAAKQAAKSAGTQAAKQAGTQAAKQAGTQAAKNAGTQVAKAKGIGAGNKQMLNPTKKSNPMVDKFKEKAMGKVGNVINKVGDKAADKLEKVPGVKKLAEENKDGLKAINKGFDAVDSLKQGDLKGAANKAKDAAQDAKEQIKKKKKKMLKIKILIAIAPWLFGLLLLVIIVATFTGGYKKLSDYGYEDKWGLGDSSTTTIPSVDGESIDEATKAIIATVPNYETLSATRKKFVIAAAITVGKKYKKDGYPTSNDVSGFNDGLDRGGVVEWIIWNVTNKDPGQLTLTDMDNTNLFTPISYEILLPGDFGVYENDIAIYMGNDAWVHLYDDTYVHTLNVEYLRFYRYIDVDNESVLPKPTTPSSDKTAQLFPEGLPTTEEQIKPYLVYIEVPGKDKSGNTIKFKLQVHKDVATDVQNAFQKIYDSGFSVYTASCYVWRNIAGSNTRSQHSYGLACDINYTENYCYYVDSSKPGGVGDICSAGYWKPGEDPYSIPENSAVTQAFYDIGWGWGGNWNSKKDYMHFSYNGN